MKSFVVWITPELLATARVWAVCKWKALAGWQKARGGSPTVPSPHIAHREESGSEAEQPTFKAGTHTGGNRCSKWWLDLWAMCLIVYLLKTPHVPLGLLIQIYSETCMIFWDLDFLLTFFVIHVNLPKCLLLLKKKLWAVMCVKSYF